MATVFLETPPLTFSCTWRSPIGNLCLTSNKTHLLSLSFVQHRGLASADGPAVMGQAMAELEAYFLGRLDRFRVPFQQPGTPFQQRVWEELTRIPFGETISYKQLAERVGRLKAVRAVGTANGRNRLPIFVPCHRVISHDGGLGGYSAGLNNKEWLLQHERESRRLFAPATSTQQPGT